MHAGILVVLSEPDGIFTKNIRMPVKAFSQWTSVLINKAARHGAVTARLCHPSRKSPAILARGNKSDWCLVIDSLPKRLLRFVLEKLSVSILFPEGNSKALC